jgi:sec-independent protein translocase protein TatA
MSIKTKPQLLPIGIYLYINTGAHMSGGILPLFGPVGPELLIILFILVLLFGASRIPQLGNAVGKSLGAFRKGREEIEAELNEKQDE